MTEWDQGTEMKNAAVKHARRQYVKVGTVSGVEFASPHRLIQMLMEGGLTKLSSAVLQMRRGDLAQKGENIGLAISIISGLQASLDPSHGGDIATTLDRLYDYMVRTLVTANLDNNVAAVEEVQGLLGEIKAGWDAISDTVAVPENPHEVAGTVAPGGPTSGRMAAARG